MQDLFKTLTVAKLAQLNKLLMVGSLADNYPSKKWAQLELRAA